jgi:hypothetical protein
MSTAELIILAGGAGHHSPAMKSAAPRKANVTDEHRAEARRLKAIWDRTQHPSQAVFGELHDIGSQSAVGNFLNGLSALSLKAARGFAKGLGCDLSDFSPRLAKMAAEISSMVPGDEDDFVYVARVGVTFSNGRGSLVFDEHGKARLAFRADYLRKLGVSTKNAVIVDSEGRSNDPDIKDGAVLLVNRAATQILPGKFYAFRLDGELIVKPLFPQKDGTIKATPANQDRDLYPEFVIGPDSQDFEMIGRVLWAAGEL